MIIQGIIFAQNYSKVAANIKTKLIEGTAIIIVDHRSQSEQFSKIVQPQLVGYNSEGILIQVMGGNIKNVLVGYRYINSSGLGSKVENKLEKLLGTHSTKKYIKDQNLYFLIDESSHYSESVTNNRNNKICYVSLVYN